MRLVCKIGNQGIADSAQAITHLMPICIIDEKEALSANMRKTFFFVDLPDEMREYVEKSVLVSTDDLQRKKIVNLDWLKKIEPEIETLFFTLSHKKIVKTETADKGIFKTISKPLNYDVKDVFATAGGVKTIGAGLDFNTVALFAADLTTLTSICKGIVSANITETATSAFTNDISTKQLILCADIPHYGNPLAGRKISFNFAGNNHGLNFTNAGAGTICIRDLSFTRLQAPNAGYCDIRQNTNIASSTILFENLFLNGAGFGCIGIKTGGANPTIKMKNVAVDNYTAICIDLTTANAANRFENFIVQTSAIGIEMNNEAHTIRNGVFSACTANIHANTGTTSLNCATDAGAIGCATDTAPNVSLTLANEFESLSIANANYFKVKKTNTSVCWKNGSDPANADNGKGIRGHDRPNKGKTSIGIDQWRNKHRCIFRGGYRPGI